MTPRSNAGCVRWSRSTELCSTDHTPLARIIPVSKKTKRLEITCPCCQSRLQVEPSSGLVISSQARKSKTSLEEAIGLEKERKSKADDLFAQAFQDEKRRHDLLEKKFQEALKVKDELEDPVRPLEFD